MRNFFPFQRRSTGRRVAAVVCAAGLLACQQKSPAEELLKQAAPAGSWLAALEMAGQQWAGNRVPASFVRNSVSAARKKLSQIAGQAEKSPASPELRAALRQLIAEADAASVGLRRAVEAGDRPRAARETARLAALGDRFEQLQGEGGGGS